MELFIVLFNFKQDLSEQKRHLDQSKLEKDQFKEAISRLELSKPHSISCCFIVTKASLNKNSVWRNPNKKRISLMKLYPDLNWVNQAFNYVV